MTLPRLLALITTGGALLACDPGQGYHSRSGTPVQDNGLYYQVAAPPGLTLLVHAFVFTSRLEVNVRVAGAPSLLAQDTKLEVRVLDSAGSPASDYGIEPEYSCRDVDASSNAFGAGSRVCSSSTHFQVDVGPFWNSYPTLNVITVLVDGLSEPLSIQLESDR